MGDGYHYSVELPREESNFEKVVSQILLNEDRLCLDATVFTGDWTQE